MSKKGSEQNPRTYSSAKQRYKNQDKHRWRKVGVWLIPLVFSVFFTLCFVSHGFWLSAAIVLTTITFLGYALFLLEWYVWKTNPARYRARVVFFACCLVVVVISILYQRKFSETVRQPAETDIVAQRPRFKIDLVQPQPFVSHLIKLSPLK